MSVQRTNSRRRNNRLSRWPVEGEIFNCFEMIIHIIQSIDYLFIFYFFVYSGA